MSVKVVNIEKLLANTQAFINTMHVVREDFSLTSNKEHIGTCINFADLIEMREEFIEELVHTVTQFVYSKNKQQQLVKEFSKDRETSAAQSKLVKRAKHKFRTSYLQGQFSELLIFNLLQHYFKAAPLLRKMPITTNVQTERNGADAIHISYQNGKYLLYIGEAKTYNPKEKKGLKTAINDAVSDVIDKHYKNHRKELNLYVFEDFIPKDLEKVAKEYLDGKLDNIEVHLVCIVTYDIKRKVSGLNRDDILNEFISDIRAETLNISNSKTFKNIPVPVLPRLNFIIFPVQEMEKLIELFQIELGAR
ncbi:hypothetical protein D3C74_242560 [compost metagenome]